MEKTKGRTQSETEKRRNGEGESGRRGERNPEPETRNPSNFSNISNISNSLSARSMKMNGEEIEFSNGFTDLHTESYRQILAGIGFRLGEASTAINIGHDIRHAVPVGLKGDYHPFATLPVTEHPFKMRY